MIDGEIIEVLFLKVRRVDREILIVYDYIKIIGI